MPDRPPVDKPGLPSPSPFAVVWWFCIVLAGLFGLLLLAGCTTTQPTPYAPINLPALPASIAGACPRPARLPTAAIDAQDVERYWATDRTNLAKCAARHAGVVGYYQGLQQQLGAAARR